MTQRHQVNDSTRNHAPGRVQRAAQELLDKVDPVSFGRSLVATAVGLARHPVSTLSAYQHYASSALSAAPLRRGERAYSGESSIGPMTSGTDVDGPSRWTPPLSRWARPSASLRARWSIATTC